MTEPEGFLSRWSRLKRDADDNAPEKAGVNEERDQSAEDEIGSSVVAGANTDKMAPVPPSIDLSKLPPIESITAVTDIRAFLAPGVPLELSRAALRRAWVVDPNI